MLKEALFGSLLKPPDEETPVNVADTGKNPKPRQSLKWLSRNLFEKVGLQFLPPPDTIPFPKSSIRSGVAQSYSPRKRGEMQHKISRKLLGILRRVINYVKTHEEGYIVFRVYRNRRNASVNELIDFVKLVRRKSAKISSSGLEGQETHELVVMLDPKEQEAAGIQSVTVTTKENEGKVRVVVKLTDKVRQIIKADPTSCLKQGKISPDGEAINYEGETSKEVISKMETHGFRIPPEKNLSPARKMQRRPHLVASETLANHLRKFEGEDDYEKCLDGSITEEEAANILASSHSDQDEGYWSEFKSTLHSHDLGDDLSEEDVAAYKNALREDDTT
ncbi:MAG TPA: hypothetical protein VMW38_24835 [Terriglobia bacterium]|nr:hypothetical protein [Terriglobia bacterium]